MQSDDITRRNISEGRSYRNIIEFTEHGYRFKPEVDVDVKQNILVFTMPKGARKLNDVYRDLGITDTKAHHDGFGTFIRSLEQGLEGVAEERKAALINHYIGGKKLDLAKDKEREKEVYYFTQEGAELFKAFFTQSPTNQYKIREKMLREQELEHQDTLAKGHYIADPLQKIVDKFVRIPVVAEGEVPAEQVAKARGLTFAAYASTYKEYVQSRVMDEALFITTENALQKLHHRSDLKAYVASASAKLAHRHDRDASQLRIADIKDDMKAIISSIESSDDSQSLAARDMLLPLATKKKDDAFKDVPYPVKRQAQEVVNDTYVGVRREGNNSYTYAFTPKGLQDYEAAGKRSGVTQRVADQPTSQTSAQGDVDTLGKGKGKSK